MQSFLLKVDLIERMGKDGLLKKRETEFIKEGAERAGLRAR
jgi:hypothetical protein